MEWRVYYWTPDRGAFVVSSQDDDWTSTPDTGVQVVAFNEGHGWNLSHGQDDPYTIPGRYQLKHGALAPDDEYDLILNRAYKDVGIKRNDL